MGKRNRFSNSKLLISKVSLKVQVVPSIREIYEAKEQFNKDLKLIYMRSLSEFEKRIKNKIELKTIFFSKIPEILLSSINYQNYYKIDPSHEFSHIFYAQVNSFLNSVLINLRNLDQMPENFIISCISVAYELLEIALIEVEKITTCLFSQSGIDCKSMSLLLFHEKLIKDRFIQKIWVEQKGCKDEKFSFVEVNQALFNNSEFLALPQKKKNRKRKKKADRLEEEEAGLDKEVEEFRVRLEIETLSTDKIKPNFSLDWIENLRKKLKNR